MAASNRVLYVLVGDDQPILCQPVCKHLQDDLHTVEIALSGTDALAKFRTIHFDLVVDSAGEKQYSEAVDLVLGKPLSRGALRNALAKVIS